MAKWLLRFASYKKRDDIFNSVKTGAKTIETRPFNPENKRNYSQVEPGDVLVFYSLDSKESFERMATFTHVYPSVKDMAKNEPVDKIFPGIVTPQKLISVYEDLKSKWGKSYAQKLEKYGIVAIGISNSEKP